MVFRDWTMAYLLFWRVSTGDLDIRASNLLTLALDQLTSQWRPVHGRGHSRAIAQEGVKLGNLSKCGPQHHLELMVYKVNWVGQPDTRCFHFRGCNVDQRKWHDLRFKCRKLSQLPVQCFRNPMSSVPTLKRQTTESPLFRDQLDR